jgi:hypothetical protein
MIKNMFGVCHYFLQSFRLLFSIFILTWGVAPGYLLGALWAPPNSQNTINSGQVSKPDLKIEALVVPAEGLYPGQRFKLIYRISYRGDIKLTKEELPFLNAQDLQKMSTLEVNESTQDQYNIQEIIQDVRALNPGRIHFGPANLEGAISSYIPGQAELVKKNVKAEAPPIEITIKPFPEKEMPASFTGALGLYKMDVELTSPSQVHLSDTLTMKITLTGDGEWETVDLPNLMCQPGFSGFFKLSDLPAIEKTTKDSKTFLITLQPLSANIASLPIVEFSSFDPKTEKYQIYRSRKIPITVLETDINNKLAEFLNEKQLLYGHSVDDWEKIFSTTSKNNSFVLKPISSQNGLAGFLTSRNVLILIPLFIVLIFFQIKLKKNWEKIIKIYQPLQSSLYISSATHTKDPDECAALVEKGLNLALKERSMSSVNITEVKSFLSYLSEIRFGRKPSPPCRQLVDQAQILYQKIIKG